ncbi:MAG: AAA family ATPase [Candidatus Nomurabacteria bacterium]
MYLKSISMQGFKSFAKKINIDLSSSVTGVVGPNGSGKSNVAEAIRFVLGEQSMKGLRSKSGSDLIFKGSSFLSPLSRASVSIHLDNSDKNINEKLLSKNSEINDTLLNFINLDEIILTREIFTDGSSEYLINGTKVRLKDVQELLAMANISASGHTIVNQGEADRILLSNNNDRREMIEDALGLRIYHMRIKEGEKKLDKVKNHLQEIDLLRRENIPHLNFLKKQVKELEKREEEINSMTSLLKVYLHKEDKEILIKKEELSHHQNFEETIISLENELFLLNSQKINQEQSGESINGHLKNLLIELHSQINIENEKLSNLNRNRDEFYKESVNLDLEIKFLKNKQEEILKNKNLNIEEVKKEFETYFIEKNELSSFEGKRETLWNNIFSLYESQKYSELKSDLEKASLEEKDFIKKIRHEDENKKIEQREEDKQKEIDKLEEKSNFKKEELDKLNQEREILLNNINSKREEKTKLENEEKEKTYKLDNKVLTLRLELEKLHSQKDSLRMKTDRLLEQENEFENLLKEMSVLIGSSAFKYKNWNENEADENERNILNINQHDLLRKVERSKIKIEESGIINAGDIMEEYKNLSERDTFLSTEINDLENTRLSLENLIKDLKDSLLLEFNSGLEQINFNFNNYFNEIFQGGKASLALEKITAKIPNENGEDDDIDEGKQREPGIEISVNLPEKKVKDLQMLSGGERALSSIALIFAMSSINHPPFMVLDETDAALDESNARRYGKMIKKLSEKSKLLVITHNRETMNQCDVLYGVTVGSEGCSKLLSIKFDQATEYAK